MATSDRDLHELWKDLLQEANALEASCTSATDLLLLVWKSEYHTVSSEKSPS